MAISLDGANGITTPSITSANAISLSSGSASAPALAPSDDTNTGIFFPAADTIAFAEGGAEAMRLDANGNVGIGNTTPSSFTAGLNKLVVGSGSGENGMTVYSGTANSGYYAFADGTSGSEGYRGYVQYAHSIDAMVFATAAAERARITSGGAFLINGTSAPLENALMAITNGTIKWTVGPTSAGNFIVYNASSIGVYLVNGSNSWTGTSDERLKNITGTISNGLSKVNSLRAVEYTWKSDDTNKPQVGLIAQDVKEVLPQVVDENASGFLGIRYTDTIPLLVAAIQELKAINDAQASRIETLESEVAALKSQNIN